MLKKALIEWDRAKQRPSEHLQRLNLLDILMDSFTEFIWFDEPIYRGTKRHLEKKPGDVIVYSVPTSWSDSKESAMDFVEGITNPVLLEFTGTTLAIENYMNAYEEEEYILSPITLSITDKIITSEAIILQVSSL